MGRDHAGRGGGRGIVHFLFLAGFVIFPSLGTVERFLGLAGVAVYLVLGVAGVWGVRRFWPRFSLLARGRTGRWLLLTLTVVAVALVIILVYPYANAGAVGGGSDRDDALLVAGEALLRGEYPYAVRTYLDNPISPLPGALLLSIPFVAMSAWWPGATFIALQNVFWLAVLAAYLARHRGSSAALLILWLPLLFAPALWRELVTGGDLWANGVYVLLAVWWWTNARSTSARVAGSLFLGLTLSSRFNFLLLLPLLGAMAVRRRGWRGGMIEMFLMGAGWAAVTLPFWLYAPNRFSPLHTYGELGRFDVVFPGAGWLIPLFTGVLAMGLALRHWKSGRHPIRYGAWILALPVVAGTVLGMAESGRVTFWFSGFGVLFLTWGVVGYLTGAAEAGENRHSVLHRLS